MYELIVLIFVLVVLFLFAGAHQEIMHKRDEAAKRHAINEENLVHLYQFAKIVAHDCSDDFTRLNARAVIETVQERAKDDQQAVALV